jgi:hypothetical protein
MGTWGTRIYEDDNALDIRSEFMDENHAGTSVREIENTILEEYLEKDVQANNDVTWLALCCVELETGTLTPKVSKQALAIIASGRQYDHWLAEAGKEAAAQRKHELTLIKKYIDQYSGQPVKRTSWLELQKADVFGHDEASVQRSAGGEATSGQASTIKTILYGISAVALFALSIYLLFTYGG